MDGTLLYTNPASFHGNLADYIAQREEFFDKINRSRWGLLDKSRPRSIPPSYSPGQKCFVRNFLLHLSPERNLQQKFLGPFSITKKVSPHAYLIDRPGQDAIVVHVNNIRPFWPELDPMRDPDPLPVRSAAESPEQPDRPGPSNPSDSDFRSRSKSRRPPDHTSPVRRYPSRSLPASAPISESLPPPLPRSSPSLSQARSFPTSHSPMKRNRPLPSSDDSDRITRKSARRQ